MHTLQNLFLNSYIIVVKNLHACFISLLGFYLAYIIILLYFFFNFLLFAHIFCFYFAHYKGGMSRSNSRNSINQDLNSPRAENGGGGGRTGLSLASMGTGRHSAARAQTPSRRGSSVYIGGNGDDSGRVRVHESEC